MYAVTRQIQYPDGDRVVEVSVGDYNYVNPGALCSSYEGENEEYASAVEAANTAIAIQSLWQSDCPEEEIFVAHGNTGGMTMPFSPCEPEELLKWAEKRDAELPRCDQCGEVVTKPWRLLFNYPDYEFCSEYCAEEFDRAEQEYQAEQEGEEEQWLNF